MEFQALFAAMNDWIIQTAWHFQDVSSSDLARIRLGEVQGMDFEGFDEDFERGRRRNVSSIVRRRFEEGDCCWNFHARLDYLPDGGARICICLWCC